MPPIAVGRSGSHATGALPSEPGPMWSRSRSASRHDRLCDQPWRSRTAAPSTQRQPGWASLPIGHIVRRVLHVQLLGEIAAVRDGEPVQLSVPHRRLLAFLALHPGPHDRDVVAARFWPDAPTARANLRTAVWALRRSLGPDAVRATRSCVELGSVRRDVDELDDVVRRDEPEALAAGLDDDWAQEARSAHRARCVALLDELAAAVADPAEAARWCARRCALTPLDEPAHRVWIERLAAAGDRAGALVAGRELALRLRAELGVGPAPATRALLARLRGPGAAAETGGRSAPMFGRARELAALAASWSAARVGRGRVVLVTGEAGIGKTRLIGELARRADNAGGRVAVGAGVDVGGEAPLAVWQELARALVAVVPAPPAAVGWPAELGRLAPDLARALGRDGPPPAVAAPELERLRLFDAVLRLVEWAAAGRPVLLVAEDVHRADRASLALCAHLGRRLAGLPVLFVLTRRDRPARPDADALLADLAGRGVDVAEVELGPLRGPEVAEIVRNVATLPTPIIDRVVAAADGNPLLAVESSRALETGSSEPPSSLRAVVRAALGGLPEPARALGEAIAAAGRGLTAPEIAALPAATDAERQLLDTGLAVRVRGGLCFRHALLAEAVRSDLSDPGSTHLAVALAVEAGTGDGDARAAEVARHLQRAGRDDLAGARWQRAARHARALGALPEAAAFWTEAVRCDPDDAAARLELAEVHAWSGRTEVFEHEWEAALATLPPAGRLDAWLRRGMLFKTVVCNPAASRAAFRRAEELLPGDAPATLRASVLLGLAWNEASLDDPERCRALLAEVAALVPDPDDETLAEIETAHLITTIRLGRFTETEAVAHRAVAAVGRVVRVDFACVVWIKTACALTCAGDLEGALRTVERGAAIARGVPVMALLFLAARAHLLSRLGRHTEATTTTTELLASAERLDSPPTLAVAQHDAGLVALAAGQPRMAADLLAAALAGDAAVSRPAARLAAAEALASCGDPDAAAAELRRAVLEPVGPADQAWALVPRIARVQGLVARARGDVGEARRRLQEAAEGWCRRGGSARRRAGEEFMAALVDLGRPPVVGLVEPDRELARVVAELEALDDLEEARCRDSR
jgi:DNA-binding SARP family transcriptional activator/tetratricopeptide (TPR) repeat protein